MIRLGSIVRIILMVAAAEGFLFAAESRDDAKESAKSDLKPFEALVKDLVKVPGLFTFYLDPDKGQVYLEIKPDQMDTIFLCIITRSAGDGTFYDNGAQFDDFVFRFKRVGKNVQMQQVNLRFRADSTSALSRAIARGVSNSIFGVAKIVSQPHRETKAILVDPAGFFIQDVANLGYFLGQSRKLEYSFDKENSHFGVIKSFPLNSEIDVIYHYHTKKPNDAATVPSAYSILHTYHYSLSTLPVTDYRPRLADDRVGYFQTIYQDYSRLDEESPYVRFINRWHLEKAFPDSELSPPKEPIVFWLENTIPEEYRPMVARGVLAWNKAFEKIGIKEALVVKQMPDTASWDPADVRYNTIRWVIFPGQAYAVGPSRANPFTGQIYDADIRICADFIRYMHTFSEYVVEPSAVGSTLITTQTPTQARTCSYAKESAEQAAFAYASLLARGDFEKKPELRKKFVEQYIVDLVMHEVGHTLGLRHNFKGSSIHANSYRYGWLGQDSMAISGSVMDYNPPNLPPPGQEAGDFYNLGPGPYDYWAIEYGYKPLPARSIEDEKPMLEEIASRCPQPQLAYGTDEDAFGNSVRGIDPLCNQFDFGDDPLAYFADELALAKELWGNIEKNFEQPGYRYQKVLAAFNRGFRPYRLAAAIIPKFVGGLYRHNDHVGDPNGRVPFVPVPASRQREAIRFLLDQILAPDAFLFPASLLNKLQPERLEDFANSAFKASRIDYPLHEVVFSIQKISLDRLFDPLLLSRLVDLPLHYGRDEKPYTMAEMFSDLRRGLWSELSPPQNINSFRRPLQLYHLEKLIAMLIEVQPDVPGDARALARRDLMRLQREITNALAATTLDAVTKAHLEESRGRTEMALKASMQYGKQQIQKQVAQGE